MSEPTLFSIEAEEAVIGAILIDLSILPDLRLSVTDFHNENLGDIFKAAGQLIEEGDGCRCSDFI